MAPAAFVNIDFGNLPSVHNVESIESEMPLLVEGCALREDGGGEGRRRGGVGMVRSVRLLGAEASYSVLSDRAVIPPFVWFGAGSGKPYHLSVETTGGTVEFDTPGKITGFGLHQDDVVVMRSSGGGGYGDPLERPVEQVREGRAGRHRVPRAGPRWLWRHSAGRRHGRCGGERRAAQGDAAGAFPPGRYR